MNMTIKIIVCLLILFLLAFSPADFIFPGGLSGKPCHANSFAMEQSGGSTGGTNKRYIDISSSHSGAYFSERSVVVGFVEISESFSMNNVGNGSTTGSNFDGKWHSGFGANDLPGSDSPYSPFYNPENEFINDLPSEFAAAAETVTNDLLPTGDAVLGEIAGQADEVEEEEDPAIKYDLALLSFYINFDWFEIY